MPLIRLLLNVLWIVTGGVWMAALWLLAACIMVITIVGIPWARAAFNIALYTFLPFGQTAVNRAEYTGARGYRDRPARHARQSDLAGSRRLVARPRPPCHRSRLGDHPHRHTVRMGASKLAAIALWPIGKMIVPVDEAEWRFSR